MCWSSHSKKLRECYRAAEEDVRVIKVMLEKVDCSGQPYYVSFFRGYVYMPKKTYVQPDAFSNNVTKFSDKNNVNIAIGFHSYSRECKFVKVMQHLLHVYSPDGTDIVKDKADTENEKYMCTVGAKDDIISTFGNNPVDACYEMILKLYELKML